MSLTREIFVTPQQAKIIRYPIEKNRTLRIVSGPGAGKTTTLVNKLAYLIGEGILKPEQILVLSMTNRAVDSIISRLEQLIGEDLANQVSVTTFHRFGHRELMKYNSEYGFAELIEDPGWRIMAKLTGIKNKFKLQKLVKLIKAKGWEDRTLRSQLSLEFNVPREAVHELINILRSMNVVTHDDLLRDVKKLLREKKIKADYDLTIVDEFQDMYSDLWELVELLAVDTHLCVAGDLYQSIYGFLGDNEIVQKRLDKFNDMDTVEMYDCFRSSPEITKASEYILGVERGVVSQNRNVKPVFMKFDNPAAQYDFIADEVTRLISETDDKVKPNDVAILTRTNWELEKITKVLTYYGIDTLKISSTPSWCDGNLFHFVDYLRILNNPRRSNFAVMCTLTLLPKVGNVTVKKLEEQARARGLSLYSYLKTHRGGLNKPLQKYIDVMEDIKANIDMNDANDIMRNLLTIGEELGLRQLLSRDIKQKDDKNHITSLILDFYESLKMFAKLRPSSQSVAEYFIQNYLDRLPISTVKDAVKLSTIHSAKGLEFPVVFMIGSKPPVVPVNSIRPEDRRVYYVGMTRAKSLMYTTVVEDKNTPIDMARFKEENAHLYQFERPAFTDSLLSNFGKPVQQLRSFHTNVSPLNITVPRFRLRGIYRGLRLCKRLL
jgi:ATP-dependent DNA helicase HMI1